MRHKSLRSECPNDEAIAEEDEQIGLRSDDLSGDGESAR
jgi:hypothetical protein